MSRLDRTAQSPLKFTCSRNRTEFRRQPFVISFQILNQRWGYPMTPQPDQNYQASFGSLQNTGKRMPDSQSTATVDQCLSRLCDFQIKSIGSVQQEPYELSRMKPIIEESLIVYDFFQMGSRMQQSIENTI